MDYLYADCQVRDVPIAVVGGQVRFAEAGNPVRGDLEKGLLDRY